ncbi:MAG TPA: hypothetical protein PLT65_01290 [Bacilli bacterium]|nr:hypothetical protein [Bacilli bacterium]
MILQDYRDIYDKLYNELMQKNICIMKRNSRTGIVEDVNIANLILGEINKGLYDRTQDKIIEELKNRKSSIELPSKTPLLKLSDEVHYAYRIVALRKVLTEIDRSYDIKRGYCKPSKQYLEIAWEEARRMKSHFRRCAIKENYTLYQDFLAVALNESYSRTEDHQKQKEEILKSLSNIGRIPNSKYENEPNFEVCSQSNITNIQIREVPKKVIVVKTGEIRGEGPTQLNIFGEEVPCNQIKAKKR